MMMMTLMMLRARGLCCWMGWLYMAGRHGHSPHLTVSFCVSPYDRAVPMVADHDGQSALEGIAHSSRYSLPWTAMERVVW